MGVGSNPVTDESKKVQKPLDKLSSRCYNIIVKRESDERLREVLLKEIKVI
jgi:hypothetical protein